jgi:hypothetical protein
METVDVQGFEPSVIRGRSVVLPVSAASPEATPPGLEDSGNDVLVLNRGATTRFLSRDPVHEEVLVGLDRPLAGAVAGAALAVLSATFQSGGERVAYRALAREGRVTVVEAGKGGLLLDLAIDFTPDVDRGDRGPLALRGRVRLSA